MARDFPKNTSNYLSLGANAISPLMSGAAQITIAAWVQADTLNTGTNDNRIISALITSTSVSGVFLSVSGSPAKLRVFFNSEVGGTAQSLNGGTTFTTGVWHHVAGVIDIANDTLEVFLDGTSDGSSSVSFVSTSYTPGTPTGLDLIGAIASGAGGPPSATSTMWDGRIAELAIWTVALSAARIKGLAGGAPVIRARPGSLVGYWPMIYDGSSVPNMVGSGLTGTVTGSLPWSDHPPISPPFAYGLDWVPYAVAGGVVGPVLFHNHYVNQGWR